MKFSQLFPDLHIHLKIQQVILTKLQLTVHFSAICSPTRVYLVIPKTSGDGITPLSVQPANGAPTVEPFPNVFCNAVFGVTGATSAQRLTSKWPCLEKNAIRKFSWYLSSTKIELTLSGLSSEINNRPGGEGAIMPPLENVLIWPP